MDTTINARATTHAVACEERLQTALKQVQDDFEAAADLQSDWIEKRLNAKLDAARKAAEAEQETNLRACEILYEENATEIDKKDAELAQLHAGTIEQRLQKKLDDALQSFRRQGQQRIDTRVVESMVQLEQAQQAAQGRLAATMIANVSSVVEKMQRQLRESQAKIDRLGQELRKVMQAAAEIKSA
ncbi:hypothetical protein PHYSODRAFT_331249 [Phytophthora sojae]|uniref:Uncharacterized protein n=1 Tax=Phytophthora sojae (strain P6497) TaxID=1094619 RepID=G4ZIJ8_PHYSP|nr:hypothetical protein PHYSODRAFT_331249 [Phytophthora sojae]EGZ17242.1 hypothetical protein PHYSODRAFT_331249 [Phytophthora sojae]|eukprot:XP_009526300.1 hypothetical protein PHYSODRAFT_331249 [Phytophthora sojae]